jgi:hypothetical protein
VASAILVELNIRLTVLVVETARLERRGVNDSSHSIGQPVSAHRLQHESQQGTLTEGECSVRLTPLLG